MASTDPPQPGRRPLVSVTTATRNRPALLERALGSVQQAAAGLPGLVEIVVSDGSDDDASGAVVARLCEGWPGGHAYVHHDPPLDAVANLNAAIARSRGEWVLVLDDDDYLLPGALAAVRDAVARAPADEAVLLFGADVVDLEGRVKRHQRFRRERYLEPDEAFRRVLRNSSFVRHPAVLVRRTALDAVGPYDTGTRWSCDTDMWTRLFPRYGVRCLPTTTCAYTVHGDGDSARQWHAAKVEVLSRIFDRAAALGVADERSVRRWEADWFHQFILAGAYRQLRARQRAAAREVLHLFAEPDVRALGVSPRWLPVRVAFTLATVGARDR
jgi:glycosyltransferase involved in cell wall biosynthesis